MGIHAVFGPVKDKPAYVTLAPSEVVDRKDVMENGECITSRVLLKPFLPICRCTTELFLIGQGS